MKAKKLRGKQKRGGVHEGGYQPDTQPDFGSNFHTQSRTPIRYETRQACANGRHDLIYLSSYIHDAEFRIDEIRQRGRSAVIPLRRARWELYKQTNELPCVQSELTVSAVKSLDVQLGAPFTATKKFLRNPQLTIFSLEYISDDYGDGGTIVISCNLYSKVTVQVGDKYKVRLEDAL